MGKIVHLIILQEEIAVINNPVILHTIAKLYFPIIFEKDQETLEDLEVDARSI
jgi:hypothetical protein